MFNASISPKLSINAIYYGFSSITLELNWKNLVRKRNAYIDRLREIYAKRFKNLNITSLMACGSFDDEHTITVDKDIYQAEYIIATGGEPALPTIDGIQHAIDSDGFFSLTKQPYKVAIIGSGYIGVELAGILNALAAKYIC